MDIDFLGMHRKYCFWDIFSTLEWKIRNTSKWKQKKKEVKVLVHIMQPVKSKPRAHSNPEREEYNESSTSQSKAIVCSARKSGQPDDTSHALL